MQAKDRIIFAADLRVLSELRNYLAMLKGKIGAIKVGMELLTYALLTGQQIFRIILEESDLKIMWDLKYGDIPATVAAAAKMVAKHGQSRILGFTVHCLAGPEALRQAVGAVPDNRMVIGVTLLTSLEQDDLDELGINGTPQEVVQRWAVMADQAGVRTIVCSPRETSDVLAVNPKFTVINPGIRFAGSDLGTQKRVTTPGQAIKNGAKYVVMGSDLRIGDPVANAERAAAEIEEALAERAKS